MGTKAAAKQQVPSITTAHETLEADQARRMRRYLYQMGFRAVAFGGAYFASGWLRWTLIAVAAVVPYIAVVLVNAGQDKVAYQVDVVPPREPEQLPPPAPGATVIVDPADPAHRGSPADAPARAAL